MKKLTPKQLKAVHSVVVMLDELENKPRRLYSSLRELAEAFDVSEAIPSLKVAEDDMYRTINEGDTYSDLDRSGYRSFIVNAITIKDLSSIINKYKQV